MPTTTIYSGAQTRWRDCYAPSDTVRLTLRTNGEEKTMVLTSDGSPPVLAGFEAPTVVPSLAVGVGGNLQASKYYAYVYVYASSKYPYVQNAVTAGGELWPRSNPSTYAVATTTAPNKTITVTVTKTTRSDVDKILIYRTLPFSTSALATAAAAAGTMFYVGTITNNGIAGTTTFVDDGTPDITSEILELDNYIADTAWFCVFDGTRWLAAGNPEFSSAVTLNNSSTVTITGSVPWFSGRDGQIATFDGITTGTYYWKWVSSNTGTLYSNASLTTPVTIPFTGTTTIHLKGFSATLYKSKPYNPFSWGFTETTVDVDGNVTVTPQSFALEMGGGSVTAMAVLNNGKQLKVDFENPQRVITYDLTRAEESDFGTTQKILDDTGGCTCHFAQFHGYLGDTPMLMGLDTYNGNILACDGTRNIIISDDLGNFMKGLDRSNDAHRFFHGQYDQFTELNCWWVRYYDTTERLNIMVWMHAPTNTWGWTPDFDVSMSFTILDSDDNLRFLIGGTSYGHIGRLFDPDSDYSNWVTLAWNNTMKISGVGTTTLDGATVNTITLDGPTSLQIGQEVDGTVSGTSIGFQPGSIPVCAVGDSVEFFDGLGGSGEERTVVSINEPRDGVTENTVTIDSAATYAYNTMVVETSRAHGVWSLIFNAAGTQQWYVRVIPTSTRVPTGSTFAVTQWIERGSTTVNEYPTTIPWAVEDGIQFGNIPCFFRTYFDVDTPVKDKRAQEFWLTIENVDTRSSQFMTSPPQLLNGRFYLEFEESSTAANTFFFDQTQQKANSSIADSNVWVTKTSVPSTPLKQWGMEIGEYGFRAFTLYNFTIKTKVS